MRTHERLALLHLPTKRINEEVALLYDPFVEDFIYYKPPSLKRYSSRMANFLAIVTRFEMVQILTAHHLANIHDMWCFDATKAAL